MSRLWSPLVDSLVPYERPSRYIVGDLDQARAILFNTPTDKVLFDIYGIQPGISKDAIDGHLTDFMAFSLDYVKRGGTAVGKWLVSA
ncbi:hypothetical protein D3C71_153980 [compost metagenome]